MGTNDKEPRSVMSRGKGDSQVVHGARSIKHHHRWTSGHRGTWPAGANLEDFLDPSSADRDRDLAPAIKRRKTKRASKERIPRSQNGHNPSPPSLADPVKS